jgi:large subunit ribosomal protein L27
MSHVKAGGSTKNLRDSNPQFLGTKLHDGQKAKVGNVIVRQRGTKIMPGKNVRAGKDHTLFAMEDGVVKFGTTRKKGYNNKTVVKTTVSVE